jgi:hypothetical protein
MIEFDLVFLVHIKTVLNDSEATKETIQYLLEQDLLDNEWDVIDIKLLKERGKTK